MCTFANNKDMNIMLQNATFHLPSLDWEKKNTMDCINYNLWSVNIFNTPQ